MGEFFSYKAYPEPYCGFASKVATACLETSILELWANDGSYDNQTGRNNDVWVMFSIFFLES
jgi:hypothetical protein